MKTKKELTQEINKINLEIKKLEAVMRSDADSIKKGKSRKKLADLRNEKTVLLIEKENFEEVSREG